MGRVEDRLGAPPGLEFCLVSQPGPGGCWELSQPGLELGGDAAQESLADLDARCPAGPGSLPHARSAALRRWLGVGASPPQELRTLQAHRGFRPLSCSEAGGGAGLRRPVLPSALLQGIRASQGRP